MANRSVKPENPQPDPPVAAPVKEQALSNLEKAYLAAFIPAFSDATVTKGVAIQNQGEGWVHGQTVIDAFFPKYREVESDRKAAVSTCSKLLRYLREKGFVETTAADGGPYFRLRY